MLLWSGDLCNPLHCIAMMAAVFLSAGSPMTDRLKGRVQLKNAKDTHKWHPASVRSEQGLQHLPGWRQVKMLVQSKILTQRKTTSQET